ncbi:Spore coat polysaccharide biosynthesis protein SpsG, predicted glycosyltransferase [Tissierella praeacuta DSM 18095]|uniref:Spore coat polysaccharide biosynthesis protein SpsG, predicted glycosyltransferase n=1 Tax=Tissierella praeacuta DSM 18095 TaxID=1123404 RepID=A0A1M4X3F0_9FIRM|nr:hypothetical protein [Tissierella praeacuta]SHE87742.1 Spore coat polysaccharide biosynthesis protein SpsG, predicted glycosyltransferase [Tissierella praeacuta DSM 18095]SUO99662.1 Spore coat polysaccharide biosynthesis protein, predicted glycosyltransferase [Tissierella praeacuta]
MKRIVIRTLGGNGIGYGHYFRCISLGKAIRLIDSNIDIIFLINDELASLTHNTDFKIIINNDLREDIKIVRSLKVDLFINDSYLADNGYLKNIKEISKLMIIDDNNDIYDSSIPNIIYNGNIYAERLGYKYVEGQIKLLGSKYLIMKEEYWSDDVNLSSKDGVLITTGGTDEYGIALDIVREIKELNINIRVIIGPGYKEDYIKEIETIKTNNMKLIYKPSSLKKYIDDSKVVITAGGSTIYEVLSQQTIPIIFSMADNQDLVCKELSDIGIKYLGKYPNIDYSRLTEMIIQCQDNQNNTKDKIINLLNNNGAKTVAKILISEIYK